MEERLSRIFASFKGEQGDLIPILQEAQGEFGYLPLEVMEEVARFLRLPESKVFGVATFYARFHLQPRGRHVIRLCCGTACHVRGAKKISDKLKDMLNVEVGGTTEDMNFTYEEVACIGACGLAPVMTIDEKTFGKLSTEKLTEVLSSYSEASEGGQG